MLGLILLFQKTAAPAVSAVLVVGGLIVGIGGFTFLRSDTDTPQHRQATRSDPRYQEAVTALCTAVEAGPDEAGERFFDRVHGPLHVLADDVAEKDRGAAADLLEAKQEVEVALDPDAGGDLTREFGRLLESTLAALTVLEVEVETCV